MAQPGLIFNYNSSALASAGQITCPDFSAAQPLKKERVLVIFNLRTLTALYDFSNSTLGVTVSISSNNVITLSSVTGCLANDPLLIFYRFAPFDPWYDQDTEYLSIMGIPRIDKGISSYWNGLAANSVVTWGIASTLSGSVASSGAVTVGTNAAIGPNNTTSTASLNSSMTNSQTTVSLNTAAGFGPPMVPYVIQIDSEQMLVTGGLGTTTLTVVRAYNGTSAATHSSSATITANNNFVVSVDSELMVVVLGLNSTSLTVPSQGRGYNGTSAASHSSAAAITTLVTALGATFTPNECEITNVTGPALILVTLDGSTPSFDNFTFLLVAAAGSSVPPFDASGLQTFKAVSPGAPSLGVVIRGK